MMDAVHAPPLRKSESSTGRKAVGYSGLVLGSSKPPTFGKRGMPLECTAPSHPE